MKLHRRLTALLILTSFITGCGTSQVVIREEERVEQKSSREVELDNTEKPTQEYSTEKLSSEGLIPNEQTSKSNEDFDKMIADAKQEYKIYSQEEIANDMHSTANAMLEESGIDPSDFEKEYLESKNKPSEIIVQTGRGASQQSNNVNLTSQQYQISSDSQIARAQILEKSKDYLGIPYVWGGTSSSGLDCSGFVQSLYRQFGYNLPRTSKEQSKVGKLVSRQELLPGDLLFFDTTNARNSSDITTPSLEISYAIEVANGTKTNVVSHVGMYIGNGKMIHASSGDGYITYADLNVSYYKNRFMNARRIIE